MAEADTPPTPRTPTTPGAEMPATVSAPCAASIHVKTRRPRTLTPPPRAPPRAPHPCNVFAYLASSQRPFGAPPPPPETPHPTEGGRVASCCRGGCNQIGKGKVLSATIKNGGRGRCLWCESQGLNITDELLTQRCKHIGVGVIAARDKGRNTTLPEFGSLARYVTIVESGTLKLWRYDRILHVLTEVTL